MAVRVVLDVPHAGTMARTRRAIAILIGWLLVLAGIAAMAIPMWFTVVAVTDAIDGKGLRAPWQLSDSASPEDQASTTRTFIIAAVIAIVAIWLGLRVIRGRRRYGLYLRKFGYGESTRVLTSALATAVGNRVRMVTLDDSVVEPLGVSKGRRRTPLVLGAICLIVAVLCTYQGIADYHRNLASSESQDSVGGQIVSGVVSGVVYLIAMFFVALLLCIAVVAVSARRAARRAQRLTTHAIDHEGQIARTAQTIRRLTRKILSPRLVVVRVAGGIWQQVVSMLARSADVVVIDVSHPTNPLLWEVSTMKQAFRGRWVLVGAYEHVMPLTDPNRDPSRDMHGALAALIDGEEILAYGHQTKQDQSRFTRALRSRLYAARAR
jgi:hypothetical protein